MSSAPALPVLYSFRRCPYAMRARLALLVSAQVCELREVVLSNKPAQLLSQSTKGTVPVLITVEGQVIDESLDIMLWALRRHDPLGWLGTDAEQIADAVRWASRCEADFKPHLDRYKYPCRYGLEDGTAHRAKAMLFLIQLDADLRARGYVQGHQHALTDIVVAPFVRQFAHTDLIWFTAHCPPRLQSWLADFERSELFARSMHKYTPWTERQTVQIFPHDAVYPQDSP